MLYNVKYKIFEIGNVYIKSKINVYYEAIPNLKFSISGGGHFEFEQNGET